jgi:2-polyprenyl-3-methyl-5-hydroxy-6-metoxy-1,4-benzoquinol methylase
MQATKNAGVTSDTVQSGEWGKFWETQKTAFYEVMKIATQGFAKRLVATLQINASHHILDYGCGPAFLIDDLKHTTNYIAGADINPFFIEQARYNHPHYTFVLISTDTEQTRLTLQQQLAGKQYDFIVLLSISQYFPDLQSFGQVIDMLSGYMSSKGRIVVADVIDEKTSSYRDALALLYQCIKRGKIISFTRFMLYVLFSSYSQTSKRAKLLMISREAIEAVAGNCGLKCESVPGLTIHPSRSNYILSTEQ